MVTRALVSPEETKPHTYGGIDGKARIWVKALFSNLVSFVNCLSKLIGVLYVEAQDSVNKTEDICLQGSKKVTAHNTRSAKFKLNWRWNYSRNRVLGNWVNGTDGFPKLERKNPFLRPNINFKITVNKSCNLSSVLSLDFQLPGFGTECEISTSWGKSTSS